MKKHVDEILNITGQINDVILLPSPLQ